MYMEGVGTMKDVNKALKWFKKAELDSNLSQTVQSLLETLAKVNPGNCLLNKLYITLIVDLHLRTKRVYVQLGVKKIPVVPVPDRPYFLSTRLTVRPYFLRVVAGCCQNGVCCHTNY